MAREQGTRGLRDQASVGPDPRRGRDLERLSKLNFRVADGEPDIRGWTVLASTGRELGRVDDLLVDTDAGEVVMLDVDLRRNDRHTLVPIRAAWIDHATKRVVIDAREIEGGDDALPTLPRQGALSDDDVDRFSDGYARAYGARGYDRDDRWHLRRGDEELRFGVEPRADVPPTARRRDVEVREGGLLGGAGTPGPRDAAHREALRDESWDGPSTVGGTGAMGAAAMGAGAARRDDRDAPLDRERGPVLDESRRIDGIMDGVDHQGIEPRELDGRVRIDEGASVDERAPVGGVRYDGPIDQPHGYGRPDERYGAEYGSGRIGFDRIVTRHPRESDGALDRAAVDHSAADRAYEASLDHTRGTHAERPIERALDRATDRAPDRLERDAAQAPRRLGDTDSADPSGRTIRYRRYDDQPGPMNRPYDGPERRA